MNDPVKTLQQPCEKVFNNVIHVLTMLIIIIVWGDKDILFLSCPECVFCCVILLISANKQLLCHKIVTQIVRDIFSLPFK